MGNAIGNMTVKFVMFAMPPVCPHCIIKPLGSFWYPLIAKDLLKSPLPLALAQTPDWQDYRSSAQDVKFAPHAEIVAEYVAAFGTTKE